MLLGEGSPLTVLLAMPLDAHHVDNNRILLPADVNARCRCSYSGSIS